MEPNSALGRTPSCIVFFAPRVVIRRTNIDIASFDNEFCLTAMQRRREHGSNRPLLFSHSQAQHPPDLGEITAAGFSRIVINPRDEGRLPRSRVSCAQIDSDRSAATQFASSDGIWSGREDSNLRPTVPKTVALPGCATPRTSDLLPGSRRGGKSKNR